MAVAMIHDRGRGPEIQGTRVTINDLLPNLLDPEATEASIGELYGLTPEQVAAARAYILNSPDSVLDQYLRIDEKMNPENPPEVIEGARHARAVFLHFKQWLAEQRLQENDQETADADQRGLPTFKQWQAERSARASSGS